MVKEDEAHIPYRVTVSEAVRQLQAMEDQNALLAICAHGFKGMEGQAWYVTHMAPAEGMVLIEGASQPE